MKDWRLQLDKFNALLQELLDHQERQENKLRFERNFLKASDIAQQFFCEKKVEMQYLHGSVETEAKTIGLEGHEKLVEDAVKIKRDELWQKIYSKQFILAPEMLLLAKCNNVLVAGRPDSVLFLAGSPLVVFEYKFSRSGVTYNTYHVQAKMYGLLLDSMGFDTKALVYAIVIADPNARNDKTLRTRVLKAFIKNGPAEARVPIDGAKIYFHRFNKNDATKEFSWALDFWKKNREAVPTRNPNKCKNCEYSHECHI